MDEKNGHPTERIASMNGVLLIVLLYTYIAGVVASSLWFFWSREDWGISLAWDLPIGIIAILLIGPAQFRLWLLGEQAARGTLFRNRWLNELVGDWVLHFPFSTATQHVRQQVLAHDRFPDDPLRDPERVIAECSGFRPLIKSRFLRLSALLKWNSLRATYNFELNPHHLFFDPQRPPSKTALHIGTAYVLLMFAVLIYLYFQPNREILIAVPLGMWILAMIVFACLPERCYCRSSLTSLYSPKVMTLMRCTFITLVNCGLGWTSYLTGRSAVLNYIALWMAPMFTTTTMLMILHQTRQAASRITSSTPTHSDQPPR